MGIVDKLLGPEEATQQQQTQRQVGNQPLTGQSGDEQAVARYRYMLQTAPPYSFTERELELLINFNEKLRFDKTMEPRISKSEIVRIGLVLARQAEPADFLAIRKRLVRLHVGRRPSSAT